MQISQIYQELITSYKNSQKRVFDSEFFFFRIYRPLSFPITAVFIRLGITANIVTTIGAVALIASMVLLASGALIEGALLYLAAYILDFVDGNIARYTRKPSYFGIMIDGLVDTLTFLLFLALAFGNAYHGSPLGSISTELFLGFACSFGFLFRAYYQIRSSFVLTKNIGSPNVSIPKKSQETTVLVSGLTLNKPNAFLRRGKWFYFALISSMPLSLVLAVWTQTVTIYLAVCFCLFVVATILEVIYGLFRIYNADKRSGLN